MAENRLLSSLPDALKQQLAPDLQLISAESGRMLVRRGDPIEAVYFPTTCLLSLIVTLEDGGSIEAEMVGKDGFASLPALFLMDRSNHDTTVQIKGEMLSMDVEAFRRHLHEDRFRELLYGYAARAYTLLGQSAVCLAFHPLEQRLARWLLMVQDLIDSSEFALTHRFLASMLGVHRPTVTLAVQTLETAGLIQHSRGRIQIMDRENLEQTTCECYQVLREYAGEGPVLDPDGSK